MLRAIVTVGAIQALIIFVSLVRIKTVAVLLGPVGLGVIGLIDQMVQLVTHISTFSLPAAAVKFLARAHSRDSDTFRRAYASFLRLVLLTSCLGTVASLAVVACFPRLPGAELSVHRLTLMVALLTVPILVMRDFMTNALAAAGAARASALVALLIAVALALAAIVGAPLGGIRGFYVGSVVAGVLVTLGVSARLRRTFGLRPQERAQSLHGLLRESPDIVTFSLILYGAHATYPLTHFVARHVVLTSHGGATVGLLQAALDLSGALAMVLGPATALYLSPIVNRGIAKEEKIEATLEFTRKLMVVVAALAMPMVLFSQWALILLFSASFAEVGRLLFLFVMGQWLRLLAGVQQSLLIGLDDLKMYGAIVTVGQLSFGILSWSLGRRHAVLGVAIAFLASNLALYLLTMARLWLRHGCPLPPRLAALVGYGLLGLLLAGALFATSDSWDPGTVLGKLGFCLLFTIGLLPFLNRDELRGLAHHGEAFLVPGAAAARRREEDR